MEGSIADVLKWAVEEMGGGLSAVVIAIQFAVIVIQLRQNNANSEKLFALNEKVHNSMLSLTGSLTSISKSHEYLRRIIEMRMK